MAINPTKVRFPFDKLLELRAEDAAAMVADTTLTGLALDVLGAYWNTGENAGLHEFFVIVHIQTATDIGDPIDLIVLTDTVAAMNNAPVEVASMKVSTTGWYVLTVVRENVEKLDTDAAYFSVKFDLDTAGNSPSVTAHVFAAPGR